ncbi:hypothetical protein [Actinoplanes sp. ATCC 53533]|uniref:hypothetical protein n=1 Tax=Actinoplanes sp. ATCC 53533 TaxID=1288362 RepID=UPI0018F5010F|nr:hypothetical protein [Actinoplanes sp. ATCC 53533]
MFTVALGGHLAAGLTAVIAGALAASAGSGVTAGVAARGAAAAASWARKAPSSPMVLVSGAGKTTVVFFVNADLDQGLQVA